MLLNSGKPPFDDINDYDCPGARASGPSCPPLTVSELALSGQFVSVMVRISSNDGIAMDFTVQCDPIETSNPGMTPNPNVIPPPNSDPLTPAPFSQPTTGCGDGVREKSLWQKMREGILLNWGY